MVQRKTKFISPAVLLLLIWVVEIVLYSLHIVDYYRPLNSLSLFFFFGVIAIVFLAGVVVKAKLAPKHWIDSYPNRNWSISEIEKKANKIAKLFIVGTFLNVVYSQGFPLLWLVTGSGKTYTEFGIPSFNGFVNALYYIAVVTNFYLYLSTKDKKYLKVLLLLVIYPLLTITRALIFTMGFELLGLFVMMRKIRIKSVILLLVGSIAIIVLFGYMGNQRSGGDVSDATEGMVRELVDNRYVDTMENLPSGFTWVYWYFTCSVNNVVYNIDKLNPSYVPDNTIKRLLPSVLRKSIFGQKEYEERYAFTMDNTLVNTFTLYSNYLKDFGVYLTIFIFFFVGLFFYNVYYKATESSLNFFLMYPAIFMVICLSVFDDFLLSLPTLFQFIITYYMFKRKRLNAVISTSNQTAVIS